MDNCNRFQHAVAFDIGPDISFYSSKELIEETKQQIAFLALILRHSTSHCILMSRLLA